MQMKKNKHESQSTKRFEDFFQEGIKRSKNKQWQDAASLFQKSIQINPNQLKAQYNRGVALVKLNHFQQAQKIFLKCIEQDLEFPDPYLSLGNLYRRQNDYAKGRNFYQIFLNISPTDTRGLYRLGSLQLADKKLDEAHKIFTSLIQMDEKNSMYYHKLGVVEWQKGNKLQAEKCWVNSLKFNGQNYQSIYRLGIFHLEKRNYEMAEKYLSKADNEQNCNILIPWSRILNWRKSRNIQKSVRRAEEILQDRQKTIKQFHLSAQKLEKVQAKLKELIQISRLEVKKQKMNEQEKSAIDEITRDYDQSTNLQLQDLKQLTQELSLKIKRLSLIGNQNAQQVKKIEQKIIEMQKQLQQLKEIKKQFGWDEQFDSLLGNQPEFSLYYRLLYSNLSGTIKSYQLVNTGVINGQNVLKSKFGLFVTNLNKVLKLGEAVHSICSFCSILNRIGQLYLEKQKNIVIQDIIYTTSSIYNERILSKYVAEAILYLSKNTEFLQILRKQDTDKPWYEKMITKLEKHPERIVQRLSSFKNIEISSEKNMAMLHTAQILFTLIRNQNRKDICLSRNPLLRAAQLWSDNLKIIKLHIKSVMIQINEHLFSTAKAFCRIIYGDQVVETETNNQVLNNPSFRKNTFELKKAKNLRLKFEIYRKKLLVTPYMIASGFASDEAGENLMVSLKNENSEIIGKLQINIS